MSELTSGLRYYVVDSFTDRVFTGNPAAVVPLDSWPAEDWLQKFAMEMNLSETAFLVATVEGIAIRWFTPTVEVDLCGHATLAAAKVLAARGELQDGAEIIFTSRSGILRASRTGDKFQLDFPVKPVAICEPPAGLLECLMVPAKQVGRNEYDYLVELESEAMVRQLRPDLQLMSTVPCRGVIVTARSDSPKIDFVSRFFAPACGVPEDPVTGSAHCGLVDYWGHRLGKTSMVGFQASSRGGTIQLELLGDRVLLGGKAVIVAHGEFLPNLGSR